MHFLKAYAYALLKKVVCRYQKLTIFYRPFTSDFLNQNSKELEFPKCFSNYFLNRKLLSKNIIIDPTTYIAFHILSRFRKYTSYYTWVQKFNHPISKVLQCSNVTTMESLELFPRNLCEHFFLKIGILCAKVYTSMSRPELCLSIKQVIVVIY